MECARISEMLMQKEKKRAMIWQIPDDEKIFRPYPCNNECDTR